MAQTIKRVARNIHVFDIELKNNEFVEYLLISDLHIDNPKCRRDLLLRDLNEARKRGAKVIINGDFFCIMQGKWDPRSSKKDILPQHMGSNYFQLVRDEAIEFLRPYADMIALIGYGNHETAVIKRHEFDLLSDFVTLFNERTGANCQLGGYGGWIVFSVGLPKTSVKAKLKMKYLHGYGGGGIVTKGVIQDQREMAGVHGADVIWMGHVHELYHHVNMVETLRSVNKGGAPYHVNHRPVHQIRTATYKEEFEDGFGGFHVERGQKPKPLGGMWMRLKMHRDRAPGEGSIQIITQFTQTDTFQHV
jgi:predicted phosphodiesterase